MVPYNTPYVEVLVPKLESELERRGKTERDRNFAVGINIICYMLLQKSFPSC